MAILTGFDFSLQGKSSEFRPASYWLSRWLGRVSRMVRRSGLASSDLIRPLLQSYLNLLLVFIPLALVATVTPLASNIVLTFNFLAIIPLSGLVRLACEDLSASLNETLGKVLVAFSDNLVEFVVGTVALCKGEIRLVQLSILGSVLCYSLFIMGSCFLVSGMRFFEQRFNNLASGSIGSLNFMALCCLLIPSTLHTVIGRDDTIDGDGLLLVMSHAIAIMLLVLYLLYLFFRLKSHAILHDEEVVDIEEDTSADTANISLSPIAAIIWLAASLTCVAFCAVALVSSFQRSTWKPKQHFLGFVLFPFLGNVTDFLSACTVALKDEMDITILSTIGSSMQLLFFTLPILVILGWIIDEPMTLRLDSFETATVFLCVFIVNGLVYGGRSNYLTGAMCIALYAIIALAAFLYTDDIRISLAPI